MSRGANVEGANVVGANVGGASVRGAKGKAQMSHNPEYKQIKTDEENISFKLDVKHR
jgi:hypothetical protein